LQGGFGGQAIAIHWLSNAAARSRDFLLTVTHPLVGTQSEGSLHDRSASRNSFRRSSSQRSRIARFSSSRISLMVQGESLPEIGRIDPSVVLERASVFVPGADDLALVFLRLHAKAGNIRRTKMQKAAPNLPSSPRPLIHCTFGSVQAACEPATVLCRGRRSHRCRRRCAWPGRGRQWSPPNSTHLRDNTRRR
jgi:hypothetical protein